MASQNPLHQFRSYSYHNFLIACSTTDIAEALANSTEILNFEVEAGPDRYNPRTLREQDVNGDGSLVNGQYVVLISGTQDAEFRIQRAEWESLLSPTYERGDGIRQSAVAYSEGTLNVYEPMGVRFMNVLSQVGRGFGTDPNTVIYMIKTIFIGHNDRGETVPLDVLVKPFTFFIYDVVGQFDELGGQYEIRFVGTNNGGSRLPWAASFAEGLTYAVKRGETIDQTLQGLSASINKRYTEYVEEFITQQNKSLGPDASDADKIRNEHIQKIKVELRTEKFATGKDGGQLLSATGEPLPTGYGGYVMGGTNIQQEDNKNKGSIQLVFGPKPSIEDIMEAVVVRCEQITAEASTEQTITFSRDFETETGPVTKTVSQKGKFVHRVVTDVNVTEDEVTIIVDLIRNFVPTTRPAEILEDKLVDLNEQALVGNTLQLDYLFTGQNVDVINFDIKMNQGMVFYQNLLTANTVPQESNDSAGKFDNDVPAPSKNTVPGTGVVGTNGNESDGANGQTEQLKVYKRLLPPPIKVKNTLARNKTKAVQTAEYYSMLEKHAGLESLEAKVTIMGNPVLMNDTTNENPTSHGTINPDSIAGYWGALPAFCKLDIRMPVKYSYSGLTGGDFEQATEPFWYRGNFLILGVKNIFDEGSFTQELDLVGLPVFDPLMKTSPLDEFKAILELPCGTRAQTLGYIATLVRQIQRQDDIINDESASTKAREEAQSLKQGFEVLLQEFEAKTGITRSEVEPPKEARQVRIEELTTTLENLKQKLSDLDKRPSSTVVLKQKEGLNKQIADIERKIANLEAGRPESEDEEEQTVNTRAQKLATAEAVGCELEPESTESE